MRCLDLAGHARGVQGTVFCYHDVVFGALRVLNRDAATEVHISALAGNVTSDLLRDPARRCCKIRRERTRSADQRRTVQGPS
jgi:hypothetical protein